MAMAFGDQWQQRPAPPLYENICLYKTNLKIVQALESWRFLRAKGWTAGIY